MAEHTLVPVFLSLVGLWLAGFGAATRTRPGLIAGFDPSRCSDVKGLSRWVGNGGVLLGGLCLAGALLTFMLPNHRPTISIVLAGAVVVGVIVIIAGTRRYVMTQS